MPHCNVRTDLYEPAGPDLSGRDGIEKWGSVPFDPRLARSTDEGVPFVLSHPEAPAALAIREITARLLGELEAK